MFGGIRGAGVLGKWGGAGICEGDGGVFWENEGSGCLG